MNDDQVLAPEDGGAVGDGQDARVDERLKGNGPVFTAAQEGGGPVLALQALEVQIVDGQAGGGQLVEILHGAGQAPGRLGGDSKVCRAAAGRGVHCFV